jgi:hypothetical protein
MKKILFVLALIISLSSCYIEPPYYSQCGEVVGPGFVQYTSWGYRYYLPVRMYNGFVMDVLVDQFTFNNAGPGMRICY